MTIVGLADDAQIGLAFKDAAYALPYQAMVISQDQGYLATGLRKAVTRFNTHGFYLFKLL